MSIITFKVPQGEEVCVATISLLIAAVAWLISGSLIFGIGFWAVVWYALR